MYYIIINIKYLYYNIDYVLIIIIHCFVERWKISYQRKKREIEREKKKQPKGVQLVLHSNNIYINSK